MKEKLTRNIGLKIISIILAALLWLIITNVEDPMKKVSFDNVPVTILNADKITSLGKVYEITEGKTIDITVAAKRSVADELRESDFVVTADFSRLSEVNAVAISIKCPRYADDITITSGLNAAMKVKLEKREEKPFKVNVIQKGKPAKGFYVYEKTARLIRVSGPKSKIEKIAQVVAEVDVTGVAEQLVTSATPKALDANGDEIDASNLEFSESTVSVNLGVYKTKTIDLKITADGKPADGYTVSNIEYDPKKIEIAAEDSILNSIDELTISEDITGASKNIEKEVNLQDQLDTGVILVGENQTAVIKISIGKSGKKELSVLPEDIDIRNKPASLNLSYITSGPIKVKVTGPEEEIKNLNVKKLKPYIDLTGYSSGTYSVGIQVDLSDYTSMVNSPSVNIHLIQ